MVPAICSGFSAATAARKRAPADASDGVPEERSVMMVLLGRDGRMRAPHVGAEKRQKCGLAVTGVILTQAAIGREPRIAPPHDSCYVFALPVRRFRKITGYSMQSVLRSTCFAVA